jgi:hypothetical protein
MLWFKMDGAKRDDACVYTDWDTFVSGTTPRVLIGFACEVERDVSDEVGGHMMEKRMTSDILPVMKNDKVQLW